MKTVETILNRLTARTPLRPLRTQRCYRRFLSMLPPRFQKAIAFVYVRNGTLHLALSHPGYNMELQYQHTLFLDLLNALRSHQSECAHLQAERVVLFVSRYAAADDPTASEETVPHYLEAAAGDFEDRATSPALREQFERLREQIRRLRHAHA